MKLYRTLMRLCMKQKLWKNKKTSHWLGVPLTNKLFIFDWTCNSRNSSTLSLHLPSARLQKSSSVALNAFFMYSSNCMVLLLHCNIANQTHVGSNGVFLYFPQNAVILLLHLEIGRIHPFRGIYLFTVFARQCRLPGYIRLGRRIMGIPTWRCFRSHVFRHTLFFGYEFVRDIGKKAAVSSNVFSIKFW